MKTRAFFLMERERILGVFKKQFGKRTVWLEGAAECYYRGLCKGYAYGFKDAEELLARFADNPSSHSTTKGG